MSVYDYEAAAKRKLSVGGWEYFNGGSADEITLRRNRSALDGLQLKPRVLGGCDEDRYKLRRCWDSSWSIRFCWRRLRRINWRILRARWRRRKGAAAAKAILVASTNSNRSIEEICKAAAMPVWFQLYVDDDRGVTRALIERAEAAGARRW